MRVFVGTTEVAGYYRGLKQGFGELGIDCTFVNLAGHPFSYGGDDAGLLVNAIRTAKGRGWLGMRASQALRFPLLWKVAREYDAFVFGFGSSLLPRNADLAWLKAKGKKVVFQFHGSDSRPPYLDGSVLSNPGVTIHELLELTRVRKSQLRKIGEHADVIVDIPPQGVFHEKPYVLWLMIGLCNRPERFPTTVLPPKERSAVRILHSPSNAAAKGTAHIEAAIERLRSKGRAIELVKIQGRPNSEVLDALEECDFVVDQLWADYAMPGFAVEAAWFGKPVVLGGYAGPMWDSLLPPGSRPPTMYCDPEAIETAIDSLVSDPSLRRDLGRRAREFVESKWSPREVASRYLRLLEGLPPVEWMFDPQRTEYWQGAGQSAQRTREVLASCIGAGGVSSLQLADKPQVERVFLEAARSSKLLPAQ